MADEPLDPTNPDVKPAPIWTWTGVMVILAMSLEWIAEAVALIPEQPRWVTFAVGAIPVVVRIIRLVATGPTSFRKAA